MATRQFSKEAAIMGTGAGVGLVQAYLTRDVLDSMFGPIPYIGDVLGVWGTYSTFGNILIGLVTFGISGFTGLIKNKNIQVFLQGYGFTTLLGGLFNGIFPNLVLAQRLQAKKAAQRGLSTQQQQRMNMNMNMNRMPAPNPIQSGKIILWS